MVSHFQELKEAGFTPTNLKVLMKYDGVKGIPAWARLPYWDWANDMLLDYMHIIKNNGHRARVMLGPDVNEAATREAIIEVSPHPSMTSVRSDHIP